MGYHPASLTLPFLALNLKRNPFGELTRAERAQLACVPALAIAEGEVVQVLGAAGRGKTTHLLAWHAAHPGAHYEYLAEGQSELTTPAPSDPFFLDEAQRLNSRSLRHLFDSVPRLVLATHSDLSPLTRRRVRSIELRGLDARRLGQIVERRIESSRRHAGPVPTLSAETLERLIEDHGDDVRSIEARLYDAFQRQAEVGNVEVSALDHAR
jgi:hypothetical protein